ncbi:MAG TPA: DHHA1 domain-containing protein, partial [Candidatus Sulfotelmatobacter sp.]|nr:DHHA1 domain-containing protein [Candidatus Sulfotelmatobacter sp.]
CVDEIDSRYLFLAGAGSFVREFKPQAFDLYLCVDCGSLSQAQFPQKYPQMIKGKKTLINIDHHPSNSRYGAINLVIEDAASTTLITFGLFKSWNVPVSPAAATCLMAGLYFDTGSFMHSNTDGDVYAAAGELLALGAKKDLIVDNLFRRHTIEKLRLLGKILNETRLTDKNVAISAVRKEDYETCRADQHDLSGAIDLLNSVKGSRFAALLSEDSDGNVRGSLRTRYEDVNLSEIAGSLGGGGHKKASGFSVKGRLKKEIRWVIRQD